MGRTRRIIFFSLAGIFLAAFAWWLLKPREPSYQGKSLTVWLKQAEPREGYELSEANPEAINAIREIGTKAIPTLLKFAAAKDTRLIKFLLKLEEKQSLISLHLRSQTDLESLAAYGFFALGPDAKNAVPGLAVLLKDDDAAVRSTAAYCLALIGSAAQAAVPDLINELERKGADHDEMFMAAYVLGEIGPPARASVPALNAALTNWSGWGREAVQAALIKMQAAPLSPFIEQLKDTSNFTNWVYAMEVVSNCGTNSGPAVPILVSELTQTNERVPYRVLGALGQIHQDADLCVPALVPFLEHRNKNVRENSISALRHFGKAAQPAVPALIRCLNDPDDSVRSAATNALRRIDPEAAAKAGVK
ncbi:MAG: putative lyase [Pedosphaera sp.]|nr:putative lyase [Pedosphaera sp.]